MSQFVFLPAVMEAKRNGKTAVKTATPLEDRQGQVFSFLQM